MPRLWPQSTIVCLGGGPSLTREDVAWCQGRARVIAINDAYRLAPWADVLYACDAQWWAAHQGVPSFQGLKFGLEPGAAKWGVQTLVPTGDTGLERSPAGLRTGKNSGYQGIGVAVHLGAVLVILLGYDMAPATDGREHWFGSHPAAIRRASPYGSFLQKFETLPEALRPLGVTVINCSRMTALKTFPRLSLAEALAVPAQVAHA